MRMISTLGMLFAASLAVTGGCTASSSDGLDPGETDDVAADGKADGASTIAEGDYSISPDYSAYWELDLVAGNKYTLHGGCKPNPEGPSCFAIIVDSGTYRLTKSGSSKYIRLYSDSSACTTCSGSDDLLVRFQYVIESYGAKLTDTSDGDTYKATLPTAAQTLQDNIGAGTLSCSDSGGDPKTFAFSVPANASDINVKATDSRGATYSVDSATLSSGNLVMSLSNDIDGPLATDKMTLSLDDLETLGGSTAISGTDTYTEGYDGTTSHYTISCVLKS
jgi:hypothetical protein